METLARMLKSDANLFYSLKDFVNLSYPDHLRPSLLVSVLDIDLRACGALRLVAFAGAVAF